jgi:hypothetical protein
MPSQLHPHLPHLYWVHLQRILLMLIAAICLLAPGLSHAVELGWSRAGKEMIYGELTEFNFEKKTVTIKDSKTDKKRTFPSSQLDIRSQWLLMLSPTFRDSIPQESSGSEHLILILYFILIPMGLYLLVFWICAVSLLGKLNPLRAVIALAGAWLLSGFLIAFYLFMIGRHPDNATPICIIGSIVTLTSASLFVAIIYHKKLVHGLALIVLPFIITPILYASAIYIPYKIGEPEKITALFENRLLIPIGILAGEKK